MEIRGNKNFPEVIRELIKKKGNAELVLMAFRTGREEEAEKWM